MINNYCTSQVSKTASYISAGLIFASMFPVSDLAQRKPVISVRERPFLTLAADSIPSTSAYNKYGVSSHSSIKQESMSFEGEVTDFFQKLSAEQEPLGREFEQVLFDNLWDLYQS